MLSFQCAPVIGLLLGLITCEVGSRTVKPAKVLMVSFDGFRWDYTRLFNAPNFNRFITEGVYAENGIKPAFVSNTFPNHYSIVTGLFVENHGIVDNNMYNSTSNESFSYGSANDSKWWQNGEPIWVTAKKNGLKTGVYFWIGSEAEIRGYRPDHFQNYNESIDFKDRVDQVVKWLKDEPTVDLALLYFNEPDSSGHKYGIRSPEFKKVVEENVDQTLGYLLDQLESFKLLENLSLLVVSDHGMIDFTNQKQIICLADFVDQQSLKSLNVVPSMGATVNIFPIGVHVDDVYKKLQNASKNVSVYLKKDIPKVLHYQNHNRLAPLLAIANEGFLVSKNARTTDVIGRHGYNNGLESMRPIFMARGPAFKKNHKGHYFRTVDIYPLLCHLLNIEPAPNNGSFRAVQPMLNSATSTLTSFLTIISALFFMFLQGF